MRLVKLLILSLALISSGVTARAASPLDGVRRVVFVGDSITYAGHYVEDIEAYLRARHPDLRCEFLDLGLPSETVSGLSEPGHAGGQFPRPCLRERLDRVLARTKPDLIVACYGMNDGIYYPFGEDRFAAYREGIEILRSKAAAAGAKVLHLTPPVFDPQPIQDRTLPAGRDEYRQPYVGYDEVLERYAQWLLDQKKDAGWDVVDVHGPMKAYLLERRQRNPAFRMAPDGVHADATGHWIIARAVLAHWGEPVPAMSEATTGAEALAKLPHGPEILKLVQQRQRLMKDAWLNAVGHERPGMAKGKPLDEAEREAKEIAEQLRALR